MSVLTIPPLPNARGLRGGGRGPVRVLIVSKRWRITKHTISGVFVFSTNIDREQLFHNHNEKQLQTRDQTHRAGGTKQAARFGTKWEVDNLWIVFLLVYLSPNLTWFVGWWYVLSRVNQLEFQTKLLPPASPTRIVTRASTFFWLQTQSFKTQLAERSSEQLKQHGHKLFFALTTWNTTNCQTLDWTGTLQPSGP